MPRIRYPVPKLLLLPVLFLLLWVLHYYQVPCLWQWLLHIPCPGCGMSRAVLAFLRGDIRAALSYHALFPVLPVLYLYILFDGRLFRRRWLNMAVLAAIVLAFLVRWLWVLL